MPELPDVVLYIEALERRILDRPLSGVRLASPFLLRTATPPIRELAGKHVRRLRRIGKRIAIGFEDDLWLVLHLMINGRRRPSSLGAMPLPPSIFPTAPSRLPSSARRSGRPCTW